MMKRILKKDFLKNKTISITLFLFIALSSFLVANSFHMTMELTNSLNALFTKSDAPHFVQMHAGEIDQPAIDEWSAANDVVKQEQTVKMLNIDTSNIDFGQQEKGKVNNIMDNYFVSQNADFDYLLDLNSDIIKVSTGEIALPLYYMQQYDVQLGETITLHHKDFSMDFTITDFVRDVQMNPSIIHSKRFVINEKDLKELQLHLGDVEYSIEFLLTDVDKLHDFHRMYESSGLPNKGPVIDYPLLKTLNAITDGMVVALIIFISILLIIIAILCNRYTILGAMEEDYREIGIMKAIGIPQKNIQRIYFIKYIVLSAIATFFGYIASLFLKNVFTENINLYLGTAPPTTSMHIVPVVAVIVMFLIIVLFCLLVFRKFGKITAVDALRSGKTQQFAKRRKGLSLHKQRFINLNIFLGLRDVFSRFKMYVLLLLVFLICSFIIVVPVNFLNTVQSSDFVKYMGIERSDIRIDLHQSGDIKEAHRDMISYIESDEDVTKYASFVTSEYELINDEGVSESIMIESGDFSKFPLDYLKGSEPLNENDIALSYLNAQELNKKVGESLPLVVDGQIQTMQVSGVYQDVTNGGRTAKANIAFQHENVLWYEVSLNVAPSVALNQKMKSYEKIFAPAKVTDIKGYLNQTFGNTIEQLRVFTFVAIAIALFVAGLITSLFLRMLFAKDAMHIAIMKTIGFTLKDIRIQYISRALFVLGIGVVLGTIIADLLGPMIISGLLSFMGAAKIEFVIDPFQAYILCPLLLASVVTAAALLNILSIKQTSMEDIEAD